MVKVFAEPKLHELIEKQRADLRREVQQQDGTYLLSGSCYYWGPARFTLKKSLSY